MHYCFSKNVDRKRLGAKVAFQSGLTPTSFQLPQLDIRFIAYLLSKARAVGIGQRR
jgi:hypothetical protein